MTTFLDLIVTNDEQRGMQLDRLIQENYIISRYTHTSYLDLDNITFIERRALIKLVTDEMKTRNDATKQAIKQTKAMN